MSLDQYEQRVYVNGGNHNVVRLIDPAATSVLDVGCGCGQTAAQLRARDPHKRIDGITASADEARLAREHLDECWVADIEGELPEAVRARQYDVLVLAHILEHLRDPERTLARLARVLKPGGSCVIAVPNIMTYKQRWQFVRGRFEYQDGGVMDETHLRFYSYETAQRLLSKTPELQLARRSVTGAAPLWRARRVLPGWMSDQLDALACRYWPNLFGGEVLLECRKQVRPAAQHAEAAPC